MKIYKHEFNDFKNEVETIEIEVEEKPKTYVVKSRVRGVWESKIRKDDIDVLGKGWNKKMFSLVPDKKHYINALIADKENAINGYKSSLEKAVKIKTALLKLLENEEKNTQ